MSQNFLCPRRDQPLLMPADMREWLPEDDLAFVALDAVATVDLGGFRRRYRADGHGRAASGPEMMLALLLPGCCRGERPSRVTGQRCARDVACRVIAGGPHPAHAAIARFRARYEKARGGLSGQVRRLLAAEGMVSLGTLSLDGAKLAGNAAQKVNRTRPQIEEILAEAAEAGAARPGSSAEPATRRAPACREAQRAEQEAWDAAAAAGKRRGRRPSAEPPRANRAGAGARANTAGPGRAGDAEPEGLCGRLQRPARRH